MRASIDMPLFASETNDQNRSTYLNDVSSSGAAMIFVIELRPSFREIGRYMAVGKNIS